MIFQVITKQHIECFDDLPDELYTRMINVGKILAKNLKKFYSVNRVAFLFSGGDIPHVHAHIFPIFKEGDITSARYIASYQAYNLDSNHLTKTQEELEKVSKKILQVFDNPLL